ncbi:fasciclin domain-containing protein [Candidatus Poseidoniaceae archaeon]|nr:fasciclin domain-containing protein [Candidatus Poseidoniaceae archaeon]
MILLLCSSLPLNASAGPSDDIPTNASNTGVHNSLVAALGHADLVTTLQGTGPFTVFAPTDQAFADAGIDLADFDTDEENETLSNILLHHVYAGEVTSSMLTDGMLAEMVNGDKVKFGVGATVTVGEATVTSADVVSSNGIIHVIDKVLMPPADIPTTAGTTGIHNSLVAAVVQADLLATLEGPGPFTVFAPTDQAFTDAGISLSALDTPEGKVTLADILLYHVVSSEVPASAVTDCMSADAANGQPLSFTVGDGVMVNDANVVSADVITSNGLIHVIDKVLTPSDTPRDIPRTAQCTGTHDSLVAAVIQAELLETLQGPGPFTVFAPTDQAFTDAGIDLASMDTPEGKAALANILLYHVVSGEVASSALSDGMTAETVNGQDLTFNLTSGVMVNDASVTAADIATSNGIIHVIDKVLMPLGDITDIAAGTGIHTSLVAALAQAELVETLQGDGPFTVFAPTDQAFTDAGIDLAALDTPEGKETLADILLYHVVAANVPSSAVTDCMTADAANSQPLSFNVGDDVKVNGATVTLADVPASNGVIHVIDKVLTPTDSPSNIPCVASGTGVHTSLVAALIQAELVETLQGDGPFTVFAPTDQAFTDAGIDLAALDTPEGKETLANILLYHVVAGEVASSALSDGMTAETVNGQDLTFDLTSGVMVNGASVTTADVATSNGVIHVIDKVLMPLGDITDIAAGTGLHDSLVAALIQAELVETLQGDGPFTVFAPTDQAFTDAGIDLAALDTPEGKETLADILLYHVVAANVPSSAVTDCMTADAANSQPLAFTVGNSVMVNTATVTLADVSASNGVIHVIDQVLTPTDSPSNIPCVASGTGVHTTLVAALIQAELVETLQGDGPFTVFAPTDQAFADAGIDLAALDTPEGKETLANILLYHVVSGEVTSSALTDGMAAEAVNGDELTFDLTSGVMVNGASVTTADVTTSNGVIHVIDKVLMPPTDEDDSSDEAKSSTDEDDSSYTIWIVIGLIVIIGGAGAVLFMRSKDSGPLMEKDLSGLLGQLEPVEATAYATQTVQQQYPVQPAQVAQPAQVTQPVQMTQAVQQPVVAEPAVLRQWTDEAGYTWRSTDDGNTYWWNGADWQKHG